MKTVTSIIIIPIGPGTQTDFLIDTLESIRDYCTAPYKVILINDSQKKLDFDISKYHCDEVQTSHSMGKQSGLYFSLCKGIKYALEKYNFQVLLRMDDDALICGVSPEKDAIEYFKKNPEVGIIGSYKTTWRGENRSFSPPKKEVLIETSLLWPFLKSIKNIQSNNIRPIVQQAQSNGYQLGEHVLGGVYFMSKKLIDELQSHKLLPCPNFKGSRLEEDHIFGMLTYAVGMKLGDFVTNTYPMCVKWRGMPTSPQEIYALRKKVIHSTRFFETMDEKAVRLALKKLRQKDLTHSRA